MLIFVPSYDHVTRCHHLVSKVLTEVVGVPTAERQATRVGFWELVERATAADEPIVTMCHGEDASLSGQDGHTVCSEIDVKNFTALGVVGYACLAGRRLGPALASRGAYWIGFTGEFTVPDLTESSNAAMALRRITAQFIEWLHDALDSLMTKNRPPAVVSADFRLLLVNLRQQIASIFQPSPMADEFGVTALELDATTWLQDIEQFAVFCGPGYGREPLSLLNLPA